MNAAYHNKALPNGALLREWRLEQVLGAGGFGIVYRGRGVYFDEVVAIKEYFPRAISDRQEDSTVTPTDASAEEIYALGLRKFVDEAKILWNLSKPHRHPNIVNVKSLFEIHGTAYMVMDFEEGVSLSQLLRDGARFDEAALLAIIRPIAEGLDRAHRAGVVHRDIKPGNILVDGVGRPVLIDFGSARFEAGQATSTQVTFYTPPYAAIEQYVKTYPQGAWTDIYALGVTLYQCVTGEKPADALERMHGAPGEPLSARAWPGFSRGFTRAVDAAMALRPTARPQSITDWLDLFDRPDADFPDAAQDDFEHTTIAVAADLPRMPQTAVQSAPPIQAEAQALIIAPAAGPSTPLEPVHARPPLRRPPVWLLGAAAAAVAVAAGGALLLTRPRPAPAPPPLATAASPATAAKSSLPSPAVTGSTAVLQQIETGASDLVADAQRAGRPAAEISRLKSAQAKIAGLIAQIRNPSAAAGGSTPPSIAALNMAAQAMARAEASALDRLSQAEWREASSTLKGASSAEAAAALQALKQSRAALQAKTAAASQTTDPVAALDGARQSLGLYTSFATAYASASQQFAPVKQALIADMAGQGRTLANNIAAVAAAAPKPWLFASVANKKAYQQLLGDAASAKAQAGQLDALLHGAGASNDVARLDAALAQATSIKQALASLYAASYALAKPGASKPASTSENAP